MYLSQEAISIQFLEIDLSVLSILNSQVTDLVFAHSFMIFQKLSINTSLLNGENIEKDTQKNYSRQTGLQFNLSLFFQMSPSLLSK